MKEKISQLTTIQDNLEQGKEQLKKFGTYSASILGINKINSNPKKNFVQQLEILATSNFLSLSQEQKQFMENIKDQLIDHNIIDKNINQNDLADVKLMRNYIWVMVKNQAAKHGYIQNSHNEIELKVVLHSLCVEYGLVADAGRLRNFVHAVVTEMGNFVLVSQQDIEDLKLVKTGEDFWKAQDGFSTKPLVKYFSDPDKREKAFFEGLKSRIEGQKHIKI